MLKKLALAAAALSAPGMALTIVSERLIRPRLEVLTDHTLANMFTGLLLILLGFLLSLPIPFTNYPFGLLLMAFALALIERDGALMLLLWLVGSGACVASALLSAEVIDVLQRLF